MRLRDKISIITGAAHGIGHGIATRFAEEGAWVLIADVDETAGNDTAASLRNRSLRAEFLRVDVSNEDDVKRAVALAGEQTGRIDVMVNNAAYIKSPWADVSEATDEEWKRCVDVSLMGSVYFTRHVLPYMIAQKSGSIINVSSIQGMVSGRTSAAYTSIKHGLIGLTRSTAYDFGQHNVRCNALCPGAIRTRISPPVGSEFHQRQIGKTFLGRTGEVDEVAAAALFLASDDASYVTGAVLAVDGGWTAM
jgi:NAD(P)-dependent dehydrogenase (short-subunit alcohol dehydrogenase family)